MGCKYLDPDIAKIVRCTFTSNRVCKQWIGHGMILDSDPYAFCEKQVRTFIPAPVGDAEGSNDE